MFLDLHKALFDLHGDGTNARLEDALSRPLPMVSVVGIGGFPIRESGNEGWTLLGSPISPEIIQDGLIEALGASAVLTHLNPNARSVRELGELCAKSGHTWALHALPVTLCFFGVGPFVEMSFNRDGSFMKGGSWVENRVSGMARVFTIHGSVKAWHRYISFKDDPSFLNVQREVLAAADAVMSELLGAEWDR